MSKKEYNVDDELLHEFLDESIDEMIPIESWFLDLEKDPTNIDIINKIFRPVHSLKGNSPFFGLLKIKELAHEMENLLDLLRKKHKPVTDDIIAKLLAGIDQLGAILESVRGGGEEVENEENYNSVLEAVVAETNTEEFDLQGFLVDMESKMIPLREFIEEGKEHYLDEIISYIDQHVEKHLEDPVSDNVPKPVTEIQAILKEPFTEFLEEKESEQILILLTALQNTITIEEACDIIDVAIDEYSTFVSAIGFDPLLREMILEKMDTLSKLDGIGEASQTAQSEDNEAIDAAADSSPPEPTDDIPENVTQSEKNVQDKTMRVPESSIDSFLDFVGELLVVQEMFKFFGKNMAASNIGRENMQEFRRILETFDLLSENLRKSILAIRTLPVNRVFQKVPRIIHDIADKTGKKVTIDISGKELLIDKSYIEILDAPIVHMIRNSIDHGIESPETRLSSGKLEEGLISISATETTTSVLIVIEDDGAGINYDAVRNKAVEIGLINQNEELSETKLVDLLFESGVSTANEVTDISGRGVGMDVVKRNIESLGGSISVTSQSGQGTTNTISLPRNITTQIVDGFLVQVGGETYVLPMSSVFESFSPMDAQISSVAGKGTIVKRHETLQTLISMSQLMKLDEPENKIEKGIIVSIKMQGTLYALAVDQIIGVQKVVVKTIDNLLLNDNLFSGAALMGDGSVAMVIDMGSLHRHVL